MKTLTTIQKLAKVGRVLSKIVYIFSMIGAIGSAVGIALVAAMGDKALSMSGDFVNQLGDEEAIAAIRSANLPSMIIPMVVGLAFCVAEAVISKFAENYFKNELADGTPFTLRGAKELMRLGIIQVAVSLGTSVVCGTVVGIASTLVSDLDKVELEGVSIGIGITFIVVSLLCRLGAEMTEGKTEAAPAPEAAPAVETAPTEEAAQPEAAE